MTNRVEGILTLLVLIAGLTSCAHYHRDRLMSDPRLRGSVRDELLRGDDEAPNFGAYSYVLFGAPPSNNLERDRYLSVLRAWARAIEPMDNDWKQYARTLNITYVPVRCVLYRHEAPDSLLANYDYERASSILFRLGGAKGRGPFIVSIMHSIDNLEAGDDILWQDLGRTAPKLCDLRMSCFLNVVRAPRHWHEAGLEAFLIQIREALAQAGAATPAVLEATTRLFRLWQPLRQ